MIFSRPVLVQTDFFFKFVRQTAFVCEGFIIIMYYPAVIASLSFSFEFWSIWYLKFSFFLN